MARAGDNFGFEEVIVAGEVCCLSRGCTGLLFVLLDRICSSRECTPGETALFLGVVGDAGTASMLGVLLAFGPPRAIPRIISSPDDEYGLAIDDLSDGAVGGIGRALELTWTASSPVLYKLRSGRGSGCTCGCSFLPEPGSACFDGLGDCVRFLKDRSRKMRDDTGFGCG
jgi:hypothetical protein